MLFAECALLGSLNLYTPPHRHTHSISLSLTHFPHSSSFSSSAVDAQNFMKCTQGSFLIFSSHSLHSMPCLYISTKRNNKTDDGALCCMLFFWESLMHFMRAMHFIFKFLMGSSLKYCRCCVQIKIIKKQQHKERKERENREML